MDFSGEIVYRNDFIYMMPYPTTFISSIFYYEDYVVFIDSDDGLIIHSISENKTTELRKYISEGFAGEPTNDRGQITEIFPSMDDRYIAWIQFPPHN